MTPDLLGLSQQIAHFEARLMADPGSRVYIPLADLYRRTGKLQEAHQILVRGLADDGACLSARVLLGAVLTELGQQHLARREMQTVLDHDPDNLLALRMLSKDAAVQGDWSRACELQERLLRLLPDDPDVRNALREYRSAFAESTDTSKTQVDRPTAQGLPPSQPDLPQMQEQPDQQAADDRYHAANGVQTPTLADLYRRQGHHDKARQIINRILAISPDRPDALAVLARLEQDAAIPATASEHQSPGTGASSPRSEVQEQGGASVMNRRGEDLQRFRRWLEGGEDQHPAGPP